MKKYVLVATLLLSNIVMAQTDGLRRAVDLRFAGLRQVNCAAGMHMSTAGTDKPHCVADDMTCPEGQRLEHDANGNPGCQRVACASENGICGATVAATAVYSTVPATAPAPTLPVPDFNGLAFGGYSYPGKSVSAINIPDGAGFSKMNLVLNTADGTWQYSSTYPVNPNGCCAAITTPSSGVWTKTPQQSYQYRIASMVYGNIHNPFPIGAAYNPKDETQFWTDVVAFPGAPTDWTTLPANSMVSVAGINMDLQKGCSYAPGTSNALDIKYTLQLRPTDAPANVTELTFDMVHYTTTNASCSKE